MTVEMSYDIGKHFQGSLEDHSALHVSVESGGKILVEGEMRAGTKGKTPNKGYLHRYARLCCYIYLVYGSALSPPKPFGWNSD